MNPIVKATTLLIGLLLFAGGLSAQAVQLDFRQFTTADGLPSSETYTVLEDQEGYIWVGTDNGVARYDGYNFEVFDDDDGLGDVVVFYLHIDDEGTVWAGTYSGRIYYFEDGRFVEFAHNEILLNARDEDELIHLIDVNEAGDVIVRLQYSGIVKISKSGELSLISGDKLDDFYVYAPISQPGGLNKIGTYFRYWQVNQTRLGMRDFQETRVMIGNGDDWIHSGTVTMVPVPRARTPIRTVDVFPNGVLLMHNINSLTVVKPDSPAKTITLESVAMNDVIPLTDTTAWGLLDFGRGLYHLTLNKDYSEVAIDTFLVDYSFSNGLYDRAGGLWLTSLDGGVFYCPYPNQRKFTDNPKAKILSIAVVGEEEFYVGYSNGALSFYQKEQEKYLAKTFHNGVTGHRVSFIHFDSARNSVITPAFIFQHSKGANKPFEPQFHLSQKGGLKLLNILNEVNHSRHLQDNEVMVCNTIGFGVLNLDTYQLELLGKRSSQQIYGLETAYKDENGRYLLGAVLGLQEYYGNPDSSDIFLGTNLGVEALNERVSQILELADSSLLFGTRGKGVVHYNKDTAIVIDERHGLASNLIRHLHEASDGTIWVSTLTGLSKITLLPDTFLVRTFRRENGLIDNEVQMVDTYEDRIYLATSSGVQEFKETPVDSFVALPVIRRILVDGDTLPVTSHLSLSASMHNATIQYGTINHKLANDVLYRYRLDEEHWSYTRERTVSFPRLTAGVFNLSIQSRNEDGLWSQSSQLSIEIPEKWYLTGAAIFGWGLLLILLTATVFLFRERRKREEEEFITQINKLEHEALHARMNPHFVFNCLNSIQNFVLEHDTKSAATYLSRFSSLIRQILRTSVVGKQTVREEVQMLEKYLDLEKLRFKTAFNHQITVDPSLDQDGISIAPLLIQPFVENAIVHGMKGRKRGGRIKVDFSGNGDLLKVVITDNGKGFDQNMVTKEDSMGMDITRQRLAMMKQSGETRSGMTIIPLFSPDNVPAGTSVELIIVPEKE